MALPTSGTYTLTVISLTNWFVRYNPETNREDIARYKLGHDGNVTYTKVQVTFNGNVITWPGGSATLSKPKYLSGTTDAGSALYDNTQRPGTFIILAKDDSQFYANGQFLDHHWATKNDDFILGDKTYRYNVDDNFSVCFLAGTLISTPSGTEKVEDLRAGDVVLTYTGAVEPVADTITWVGKSTAYTRQNTTEDEANYPVRVLKDAIADGVPFKDLLITSEHCLFIDGSFIPARMLVNGSSIVYDTSFTSYDYYHIETERHSVIMADGMLTESYLDTGNRHAFLQDGNISFLNVKTNKTWEKDAAAPLTISREIVEPIYRQIEARAQAMQRSVVTQPISLTDDADIHLMTENGQIIRPTRQNGNMLVFQIPGQTNALRIMSRSSRPCDTVGPFVDDRRTLGVLVGNITIFTLNKTVFLTRHLQEERLSGWHSIETTSMRWTNGNAELLLTQDILGKEAVLSLQIITAGPYLVSSEQTSRNLNAA